MGAPRHPGLSLILARIRTYEVLMGVPHHPELGLNLG